MNCGILDWSGLGLVWSWIGLVLDWSGQLTYLPGPLGFQFFPNKNVLMYLYYVFSCLNYILNQFVS
jgi:hypothetical protein